MVQLAALGARLGAGEDLTLSTALSTFTIPNAELCGLVKTAWLTDQTMAGYLLSLCDPDRATARKPDDDGTDCLVSLPFFEGLNQGIEHWAAFQLPKIHRWMEKWVGDLWVLDTVYILRNPGNHWYVLAVDLREKVIRVYDSLYSLHPKDVTVACRAVQRWLTTARSDTNDAG